MTTDLSIVGELSARYDEKPFLRALLQLLVPRWGVADTLLQKRAAEIRHDRRRTFFDELAQGEINLTDKLIEKEDFLHAYFATIRAVDRTRKREKIRLLARLFESSVTVEIDEYEELLSVLEAVTLREFSVLRDLQSLELQHPRTNGEHDFRIVSQNHRQPRGLQG